MHPSLPKFRIPHLIFLLAGTAAQATPLFNSQDLTGWYGDNPHKSTKADDRSKAIVDQQEAFHKHWTVENGILINDGQGPYAVTEKEYGDIELSLQYKTVAQADSGIYLRGSPQVQIWDTTEAGGKWHLNAQLGSGGLYNNPKGSPGKDPLLHADKPFGEWNHLRIRQIGSYTWVWLNQALVVDRAIQHPFWDKSKPLPATGPILLQTHGGEIQWKEIHLTEITPEAANALLRGSDDGFTSILNSDNLNGWFGDKSGKTVSKGVLHWDEGGSLYTEKEYSDFILRLEFITPPGGNNGIAIRYPGKGNPAYDGMCELQILDNPAARYAELDPRQYHGSVYGAIPAHRGYLRPNGQWNYQEVTVQGYAIKVELNGTLILEGDVSKIQSFLDDKLHPGLNLKKGHIGFAGHGKHPFKFRNIAIKEL